MRDIRTYWVTLGVIGILLCGVIILCSGCSANTSSTTQSIIGEVQKTPETEVIYGNYFLFETRNKQEYLNFLEEFDEEKYEIVNISTSMYRSELSSEFYMVTYKIKEIEKSF